MKSFVALCCLLLCALVVIAQPANWSIKPYEDKYFVENIGQWGPETAALAAADADPVIAGVDNLGTEIYYRATGFEYRHRRQRPVPTYLLAQAEEENEPDNEGESHERMLWDTLSIQAQWLGVTMGEFSLEDPQAPLFHYASPKGQIFGARSYAKLRQRNLYPGVDLAYSFHPTEGIKYDFTVHPGGEVGRIALQFSGMDHVFLDAQGDVHVQLGSAELIDHAPTAYVQETGAAVPIRFVLSGAILRFEVGAYDASKTLIIDPWIINPGFTTQGKVFDVGWDCSGNVYAFGGSGGWKVKKFNSAGTLQWTYITSHASWYGDLISDDLGNIFIIEGCCNGNRQKLNTAGAVQWTTNNGTYEFWRLAYTCDWSKLVLANAYSSGAIAPTQSLSTVNTTTGVLSGGVTISASEPRSITGSPSGNFYVITAVGNELLARTNAYAPVYNVPDGYSLLYNGPLYSNGTNTTQGQNAIAVYSTFVYTFNGATLMKRDITTGALLASVVVPGGVAEQNSGVAVDNCGNVFVGSNTAVYQYDANLNSIGSTAMTGAVYDVTVSGLSAVLIAGNGLLSSQVAPCASVCPTCIILPAGLSGFEVNVNAQGHVDLHWTLENAANYVAHTVERSADGANFVALQRIPADRLTYDWEDIAPLSGYSWYRLAMQDAAGETHYGPVRQVLLGDAAPQGSVFPNPMSDALHIALPEGVQLESWQLLDLQGQVILRGVGNVVEGEELPNGIYVLEVTTGRGVVRMKVMKGE